MPSWLRIPSLTLLFPVKTARPQPVHGNYRSGNKSWRNFLILFRILSITSPFFWKIDNLTLNYITKFIQRLIYLIKRSYEYETMITTNFCCSAQNTRIFLTKFIYLTGVSRDTQEYFKNTMALSIKLGGNSDRSDEKLPAHGASTVH